MTTLTELRSLIGGQWTRRGVAAVPGTDGTYDVTAGGNIQSVLDASPEGDTIYLGPGDYRLTTKLIPKKNQRIIGPSTGYATLRGDRTLTGWTASGGNWYVSGQLPSDYSDTNGQCEINTGTGANPCQKREQLWFDDVHMVRVMRLVDLIPGAFFEDYTANRVYINQNPAGHDVEMTATTEAINSTVTGVTLSRLKVIRFASAAQSGAVVIGGTDWEVSYSIFTQNHAIGLHMTGADRAHVHHNDCSANGQLGMGHHQCNNTVVEYNTFNNNNTDGFWRADWESGGFKATFSAGVLLQHNTADNNEGVGFWFDIDNQNPDISSNVSTDNYADGLRFEISFGAKIHDNTMSGNGIRYATLGGRGSDYSLFAVGAININSSPDVEIYNNTIIGNENAVVAQMRNRGNSSSGLGARDLHNLYVHNNQVTVTTGARFGEGVQGVGTLSQTDPTIYFAAGKNNRFDYNQYTVNDFTDKKFAWNSTYLTYADFQAAGQELHGSIAIIPRPGFRVPTALDDGHWTLASTSSFSNAGTSALVGDYDGTNYGRAMFLRFTNVNIPHGATIDTAKLDLKMFGVDTAIPPMRIVADKATDSAQPANRTEMNARTTTTANTLWTPTAWTINAWTDSPPIAAIIQEIVAQSGWVSGNAITVFIEPATIGWTVQQRVSIRTYENAVTDAAGLVVTWH